MSARTGPQEETPEFRRSALLSDMLGVRAVLHESGEMYWKGTFVPEKPGRRVNEVIEIFGAEDNVQPDNRTPEQQEWFDKVYEEYKKNAEEWRAWRERNEHLAVTLPNGTKCYGLINYPDRLFKDPEPDVTVGPTE
jgi:hypothetical protein